MHPLLVTAVLVGALACQPLPRGQDVDGPSPGPTPAPTHTAPGPPSTSRPPPPAPGGSTPAPPTTTEPAPPAQDTAPLPSDTAGLGAMCRPYLRADVGRLVVEIDHQAGARPETAAVDHLLAVLRSVVAKPEGVVLAGGGEIPGQARTWTAADLRATAAAHRSQYSSTGGLAIYVLSVRGEFADAGALGVAHNASEVALFPDQIGGLTTLLGGAGAIQRSVLTHEVGHLLCLVNITYRSAVDHEDPDHPHHSSDRSSVMHWAIDTSAVAQVFDGPPPDDFAAADRADLEGLRTGRY